MHRHRQGEKPRKSKRDYELERETRRDGTRRNESKRESESVCEYVSTIARERETRFCCKLFECALAELLLGHVNQRKQSLDIVMTETELERLQQPRFLAKSRKREAKGQAARSHLQSKSTTDRCHTHGEARARLWRRSGSNKNHHNTAD